MAVESSNSVMDSLLEKLRLEDPWVPPRSWDSLPSQASASSQPPSHSSSALYTTSSVSEPSLVRLAMNALQGVESALMSIEKLSALFCCCPADRTSHRIPSLWIRCSSTVALGNVLASIGHFGCIIFLLHRFVNYFTTPDYGGVKELEENPKSDSREEGKCLLNNFTLINQAFAISVGKVIDGYISALNTLSASVSLRRFSKTNDGGCLTRAGHSEITFLEVYLHTTGLRTQVEALGNLCNVNHLAASFCESSLEDLKTQADSEFSAFPRSGALLSFLYAQLKVADPDHCALLKFLFLQSYEPYCDFIRAWIYDGSISDPYHEFAVECISELSVYASGETGIASDSPLPTIRVRDGAAVPCFLEECLVPLCRTGQQLQVIMKLLEFSNNGGTCDIHGEILPHLVGLSTEYPWFEFPLTFDKETIETMVLVRASYYQQMLEMIESILAKFDFSSQQAASQSGSLRLVNNLGKNLNHPTSSVADKSLTPPQTDKRNQNMPDTIQDSDVSSMMDEFSYADDHLESSECSSSGSFEEHNEAEKLVFSSHNIEPSYLSALDFSSRLSTDNIMQNHQSGTSCSMENFSLNIKWKSDYSASPSHKETYLVSSEQKLPQSPETWFTNTEHEICRFDGHHIGMGKHDTGLHSADNVLELSMGNCGLLSDIDVPENASKVNASDKDQHLHVTCSSSNAVSLHFSNLKYDCKFFSMNPTLNRGSFFNQRTISVERGHANYMYSYFDFTSVKDPLNECAIRLAGDHGSKLGTDLTVITEAPSALIDTSNHLDIEDNNDIVIENNVKSCKVHSPLPTMGSNKEHVALPNISGGSAWQSLLDRSGNIVNRCISDQRTKLVCGAEVPLDFVIKKCVLDEVLLQSCVHKLFSSTVLWPSELSRVSVLSSEDGDLLKHIPVESIMSQYKYLSKLTIKLLIEGFKLQEHLQALRCYHFMELADWADLFIMSLWHRKWQLNEVDKRIPEIQAVLELAVQRSSCEGDPNKDRLFVYLKEDASRHLSASAMGIRSFDFLGLGYRIDWPISIVLTPAALKIYSEIFNFLIQIKLAVFSLSDVWCLLKGYRFDQHEEEVNQISVLTETRHKVNHFVSTLQQYVQSQLSQVSWYRFLHSLKHKVKDMLDLESVHMAYLTESLHICFLSKETQSIAGIIQNILQCAMDFQSCLSGSILGAGSDDENLNNRFSRINILKVQSIRKAFAKNLEELYLIYLQSPKHGESGLSRFWDYLNYNEYYAGVMNKQMGHCIFYS